MTRLKPSPDRRPPTADRRSLFHHIWPILIYFLLTILMTWPTVLHLTDGIPGDGFDGWQNYWNIWWVKKALLELGTTPFFTDYLYPPNGASLLFHTLNIFNSFWTLPIQLNFGLAIAYNAVVLVSFTLAGYGGYLLALDTLNRLRFTGRGLRPAAFVGGLVFTMSPFHFAHLLGHMQVFSMIWPPFYVLWLLRTLQPPSPLRRGVGGEVRNAALACLFLILATLVDWYHTLYLLIFTGLMLAWVLWRRGDEEAKRRGREVGEQEFAHHPPPSIFHLLSSTLYPLLLIGLGFALALSPMLVPMIRAARSTPELQTGLEQSITLSADLLAFILPSEMHPLWGQWAKTIADTFSTTLSERLIFAGFVPLALAALAIGRSWRQPWLKFWAFITASFFVLALGPYLHIGGKIVTLGGWPLPLPYLLLYHTVPFIGLTRSLSRYDLMVMLGLGVLAAIGLAYLSGVRCQVSGVKCQVSSVTIRHSPFTIRHSLPLLAALLICFEFLAIPYPISKIDTPQFYFDLAQQPGDFAIAELPMNWDRPTPMLYQTAHGKRLLTAYTSRDNPLELAWRTPVFQHWRYLGPDIIDQPLDRIAPTIFYDFNLRYIVLDYYQMPPGPEREATERWVAAALPNTLPIYDDGRLKVYPTPLRREPQPYLSLGQGWSKRQETANSITRAITDDRPAELFLHHPQNRPLILEITAASPGNPPPALTVFADGEPLGRIEITQTPAAYTLALPPLSLEWVKLSLQADSPSDAVTVWRLSLKEE
ncbi:MAG: hypothetical protein DPW09_13100 [Anaerolineae bacterium]|nr:hypothetical protein [Anaerolineales bacterium]MCQ3974378.1 hypothetical protein [Anaerolineae bacterium]